PSGGAIRAQAWPYSIVFLLLCLSIQEESMSATPTLVLRPGRVTLAELRLIQAGGLHLELEAAALQGMADSLATVQQIVEQEAVVYGINTGFGKLASTKI